MLKGLRWLAFVVLVLVSYFAIQSGWLDFLTDGNQVSHYLHSHGMEGLITIILLGAMFTGLGGPRQLLAFVFGFALGGTNGALVSTLTAALGATGCYFTARWLLRTSLIGRFGKRMGQFDDLFREQTLFKVLMVRLLPVGSNLLVNLLAGCSGIRYIPFLVGSIIGYLPQMLIFALAGAGIGSADEYKLMLSLVLFIIASLIGALLYRSQRTKTLAKPVYDRS